MRRLLIAVAMLALFLGGCKGEREVDVGTEMELKAIHDLMTVVPYERKPEDLAASLKHADEEIARLRAAFKERKLNHDQLAKLHSEWIVYHAKRAEIQKRFEDISASRTASAQELTAAFKKFCDDDLKLRRPYLEIE